jgi:predicted translin family RNA/ssDNA-binding protein
MKQNKYLLYNTLKELIHNVMDILPNNSEITKKFQYYLHGMTEFKTYAVDTIYNEFSEALQDKEIKNAITNRDVYFFKNLKVKGVGVVNEIKEIQNVMLEYLNEDSQKIVWEYIDLMVDCLD